MPAPMDNPNFRERTEQLRHAIGFTQFQRPPAQQPSIEMPDAEGVWELLQCCEEIVRRLRDGKCIGGK